MFKKKCIVNVGDEKKLLVLLILPVPVNFSQKFRFQMYKVMRKNLLRDVSVHE